MKPMTTKEIVWDSQNLPADISEVKWVMHSPEYDAAVEGLYKALKGYCNESNWIGKEAITQFEKAKAGLK